MNPYEYEKRYKPLHLHAYERVQQNQQLINDIQRAISGEYTAITCYEKLAKQAPTEDERNRILEIQKDEKTHLEKFTKIYLNLTGKSPQPVLLEKCPGSYGKGLEAAFRDEQMTVDFYLEISDQAQDPYIKEAFRRVAADEQNHAVWFLFYISKNSRKSHWQRQGVENYGAKGAINATTITFPQMLTYAMQDEYLAQARYNRILDTFGNVRTFTRIKEAELRHITALNPLFSRYQVPLPKDISTLYVTTPSSLKNAYAAGVQGEIDNIAMYEKFLSFSLPQDVRTIFTQLRNASMNHLQAFQRGLERENNVL